MRYFIFAAMLLFSATGVNAQNENSDISANGVHAEAENPDLVLADNYFENEEWEKAVAAYERAKPDGKFTSIDLNRFAIAFIELDRYEDAQRVLENLTRLVPDDEVAWFNLGIVHIHFDRYPSALSCFERAAEIDPRSARTWYCIGYCELAMGDIAMAWETLDYVIALDEDLALTMLEEIVAEEEYRNDPAEAE